MHKMNSHNDGKNSKLQEFWKKLKSTFAVHAEQLLQRAVWGYCISHAQALFPSERKDSSAPFWVQILIASKLWSGKPRAKKKAKEKTVSLFSFLIWKQLFMLSNRLFMTTGILVTLRRICTLYKSNRSWQRQRLCLSRIWAEAAHPCVHEALDPPASPTHSPLVCQTSCGPFGDGTIDDSTTKERGSVGLIESCHF